MIEQASSKKVAFGLLIVCVLALVVGIFNAVNHAPSNTSVEPKKSGGMFSSLGPNVIKRNHLMLINLAGPIMMESNQQDGLFSSDTNAVTARKALEEALEDDNVKGVLLAIDSPGGTVGMSQELNAAVARVREKKPILAYFGDMAASGGYYTACAATKIMSNPGTLTGSIGVIISTMNFRGLMEDKLGVKAYTIKSGKFKDILSPYRTPTPDDLALIQNVIDTSYQQFLHAVLDGRTRYVEDPAAKKALSDRIRAIADGRVVTGEQAKEIGLVDEIGDITKAYETLDQMAKDEFSLKGKDKLPLEEYEESGSLLEMLGLKAIERIMPQAGSRRSPLQAMGSLVPLSMQYPNQPLWVLE